MLCYQLMPNHWHLVLRYDADGNGDGMERAGIMKRGGGISAGV